MNTTHTPGPWLVTPKPVGSFGKNWLEIQSSGRPVVHCGSYEKTQHGETWTECGVIIKDADALLIAAAPDLLEVAKRLAVSACLAGVEPEADSNDPIEALLALTHAAIAKATGKEGA